MRINLLRKPCVHDARNLRSRTERELINHISQLAELLKLINSFSVRDLGTISSIVDTRFSKEWTDFFGTIKI